MDQSLGQNTRRTTPTSPGQAVLHQAVLCGFLIAMTLFAFWNNDGLGAQTAPENLRRLGARVYAENCAVCHGQNGEGHAEVAAAPALDASEHAWHHPDEQLQQQILEGGQVMPSFRDQLTNEEIVAVIRYFQTWWAPGQLQSQQSISAQFPLQK